MSNPGTEPSVFTRIINREIPSEIVFEDEELIVIKSIDPIAPIHLLGISKKPLQSLHELLQDETNKDLLWNLYKRLSLIATELKIDQTGYSLKTNIGFDGGQSVMHLHIHMLGGTKLGE